jgi:hypothetical protein
VLTGLKYLDWTKRILNAIDAESVKKGMTQKCENPDLLYSPMSIERVDKPQF